MRLTCLRCTVNRRPRGVFLLLLACWGCWGCSKYYVTAKRERIDKDTLASTFVKSPDPRQYACFQGEEITFEWRLPRDALNEPLELLVEILYNSSADRDLRVGKFVTASAPDFLSAKEPISVGDRGDAACQQEGDDDKGNTPLLEAQSVYKKETRRYPLHHRRGTVTLVHLDQEEKERGKIITYRARIVTKQGRIIKEWKQQLWTELITVASFSGEEK